MNPPDKCVSLHGGLKPHSVSHNLFLKAEIKLELEFKRLARKSQCFTTAAVITVIKLSLSPP